MTNAHPDANRPSGAYEFVPHLGGLRDRVLFGEVWEAPELTKRDRSLITVATLISLYRTEELKGHMNRAITNGVTKEELQGIITHLAFYAGWPKSMSAVSAAREVFGADKV